MIPCHTGALDAEAWGPSWLRLEWEPKELRRSSPRYTSRQFLISGWYRVCPQCPPDPGIQAEVLLGQTAIPKCPINESSHAFYVKAQIHCGPHCRQTKMVNSSCALSLVRYPKTHLTHGVHLYISGVPLPCFIESCLTHSINAQTGVHRVYTGLVLGKARNYRLPCRKMV